MKKKVLFSIIVILGVAIILSFAGCAKIGTKIAEKAIENAAGGDVDLNLDKGGATIKDEKGGQTQIGENVKLPDGWPSDTPVYPDVKLSMSTKTKNGDTGKNEFSIIGEITKGSIKDVYNWYKDKYGSGWEAVTDQYTESNDGDIAYLNLKSNKYEVGVMLGKSGETTSMTMTVIEQ
ncbi:MAG: hypothetical protein M1475_05855 [Actinobacteria bacterium]|nr:hypothetical protein [Actinomycetota bacterium]MCL6087918.1 hypothetical protein [Actinomycetota bacterium]